MKKLWIFGDSFSTGHCEPYISWKGYIPKLYFTLIAEEMDLEIKNYAIGGCSNRTILSQFINVIDEISKDDIIIFNWTAINRHRIISNKKLKDIVPFETTKKDINTFISINSIVEYSTNRIDSFAFYSELNEYIKLIKCSKPNNLIINWTWCYFDNPKYELIEFINNMDFYGLLETIIHETNNEIQDWHYAEAADRLLADIFKEIISNPKERKKYRINTHSSVGLTTINKNKTIL